MKHSPIHTTVNVNVYVKFIYIAHLKTTAVDQSTEQASKYKARRTNKNSEET